MTAPLPPPSWARDLHGETEVWTEEQVRLAVREALERVKSGTVVYELHNGMIIKAVPIRHIESVIEEYKDD